MFLLLGVCLFFEPFVYIDMLLRGEGFMPELLCRKDNFIPCAALFFELLLVV